MLSTFAFADESKKLVLLTSAKHKKIDIKYKLKKIFIKKFRNYPFELIIKQRADQGELYKALNDNFVDGVFWVSHGAFVKPSRLGSVPGMSPVRMILDVNHDNIAPVFQKIHPNIEFVGIIGCNSKQILKSYRSKNM